jgi:arylsulfatase A-like enzyme
MAPFTTRRKGTLVKANRSRASLPLADPVTRHTVAFDAKDPEAVFDPIEPLRPPAGAPNILLILLDDLGFGASSAFGGPCDAPVMEQLAAEGLRYTRFHTTALCAPTRAALLTGRNHHTVGMGSVPEVATSAPGNSTLRPKSTAPLPEILKLNGYSTAQFGKCHEVPVWETSPMGPFDHWPTGSGFEYFYGFLGGETNQYYPGLYEGTKAIEPPKTPEEGYHLTEDLADKAIAWIRRQKALMPDKPFFAYFAPGATHAPHQVPREWADRYKGRFDDGWDALRVRTLARQKELGVVPPDAELTVRHAEIPAWDDMPEELKPVLARQMEIYAGFLTHTDHHVGRVVDAVADLGILDETLVVYITGDNGASGEGTINGSFNENIIFNGAYALETPEFMAARIDEFGGPTAYNHFAVGWAHAMDTPYQWTKQVASHWGGTRNAMIVRWPARIAARGEVRPQFHHVIDIAPTILELADIPEPAAVNGIAQKPMEGVSLAYSFNDAAAPDRHETQYFEVFCNRGIYHKGWTAVTRHSTPWVVGPLPSFDDDVWELYDTTRDWTQAHDLAAEMPEKLHELQRLWLMEAVRHGVLPLDDRRVERFNPDLAGRPQVVKGASQLLFGEMGRLTEASLINVKNKSHSVTAEVEIPEAGGEGVLIAQGGAFGGWVLYLKDGAPAYCHNLLGLQRFKVASETRVPAGRHQVRMEFTYDGGGLGKGGRVALYLDGSQVGEGHLPATVPLIFSADETADVGRDGASPVSDDYATPGGEFTGTVDWVQIDVGESGADHIITAEERFRIAMARQ